MGVSGGGGCLLDRWGRPSNNDLLRSMLINEGVPGSLQAYYGLVRENDLTDWAGVCVCVWWWGGLFYAGDFCRSC